MKKTHVIIGVVLFLVLVFLLINLFRGLSLNPDRPDIGFTVAVPSDESQDITEEDVVVEEDSEQLVFLQITCGGFDSGTYKKIVEKGVRIVWVKDDQEICEYGSDAVGEKSEPLVLFEASPQQDYTEGSLQYSIILSAAQVELIKRGDLRFTILLSGVTEGKFFLNQLSLSMPTPIITTFVDVGINFIELPEDIAQQATLLQITLNPV